MPTELTYEEFVSLITDKAESRSPIAAAAALVRAGRLERVEAGEWLVRWVRGARGRAMSLTRDQRVMVSAGPVASGPGKVMDPGPPVATVKLDNGMIVTVPMHTCTPEAGANDCPACGATDCTPGTCPGEAEWLRERPLAGS